MFTAVNLEYISGEKKINIHATAVIFQSVIRVMRGVIEDLNTIVNKDKMITFTHIRKFILGQLSLQNLEISLYAAFKANENDLFYQDPQSADWRLMRQNLEISQLDNEEKYAK